MEKEGLLLYLDRISAAHDSLILYVDGLLQQGIRNSSSSSSKSSKNSSSSSSRGGASNLSAAAYSEAVRQLNKMKTVLFIGEDFNFDMTNKLDTHVLQQQQRRHPIPLGGPKAKPAAANEEALLLEDEDRDRKVKIQLP